MGCCSAPNCSNSSSNKDVAKRRRVFRFPTEKNRRQRWIQNCRRDKWNAGKNALLCEDHFEKSQYELHRADGCHKLKPNAIPTLFNVPNPPKLLGSQRIKGIGMPKDKKPPQKEAFDVDKEVWTKLKLKHTEQANGNPPKKQDTESNIVFESSIVKEEPPSDDLDFLSLISRPSTSGVSSPHHI